MLTFVSISIYTWFLWNIVFSIELRDELFSCPQERWWRCLWVAVSFLSSFPLFHRFQEIETSKTMTHIVFLSLKLTTFPYLLLSLSMASFLPFGKLIPFRLFTLSSSSQSLQTSLNVLSRIVSTIFSFIYREMKRRGWARYFSILNSRLLLHILKWTKLQNDEYRDRMNVAGECCHRSKLQRIGNDMRWERSLEGWI